MVAQSRSISTRNGIVSTGREPLICTPLVGRTEQAILAELAVVVGKRPDLIEWRADFFQGIGNTSAVLGVAEQLRTGASGTPIIFTIRSAHEGGEPLSLSPAQIAALDIAICEERLVELIDIEMSTDPVLLQLVRTAARDSSTKLILSFHDFAKTPAENQLLTKFFQARDLGADIAKVAVTANAREDVLTLLAATLKAHQAIELPLISMAMGHYGVLTRLFGSLYGSSVSFAAGHGSSAPGQLPIEDLNAVLAVLRRSLHG